MNPMQIRLMWAQQQGAVLLESLISILIFSIGIIALVGVQAVMIKNTNDSRYRAEAAFIAQQKIGLMWANPDPTNFLLHEEDEKDISDLLPEGTRTVTQSGVLGQFVITITWKQPGSGDTHVFTTTANITGG